MRGYMVLHTYFEPLFQPIVTRSGSVWAYEALLRMKGHGPEKSPEAAISRWEKSGYIRTVDVAMIERVVEILRTVRAAPRVCVNVSVATVEADMDGYLLALEKLSRKTRKVIVELTETAPIHDIGTLMAFCKVCHARGYAVALDDCWPAHPYGDPALIRALRPRAVKIDGKFMQKCMEHGHHRCAENIIDAARDISAAVIVEWIESRAMYEFACLMGADMFQGHHLGEPSHAARAFASGRLEENSLFTA